MQSLDLFFRDELSVNSPTTSMSATYLSTVTAENGGYVVNPSTTITLNGKVRSIFEFNPPSMIDKYTHLEFNFVEVSESTGKGICMYKQPDGPTEFSEAKDVNCIILGSSDVSTLDNVNVISGNAGPLGGSKVNWALGKPATQSTTYSSGIAGNAVDGDTASKFNFQNSELNSVTSTTSEIGAWWMVDMLSSYKIKEVIIYKRVDGYSGRLLNYDLEILNGAEEVVWGKTFDDTDDDDILVIDIVALSGRSDLFGQKGMTRHL